MHSIGLFILWCFFSGRIQEVLWTCSSFSLRGWNLCQCLTPKRCIYFRSQKTVSCILNAILLWGRGVILLFLFIAKNFRLKVYVDHHLTLYLSKKTHIIVKIWTCLQYRNNYIKVFRKSTNETLLALFCIHVTVNVI